MTQKDIFLGIESPKEYNERRSELKGLDWTDEEVRAHCRKIFPSSDNGIVKGFIMDVSKDNPQERKL